MALVVAIAKADDFKKLRRVADASDGVAVELRFMGKPRWKELDVVARRI
jgi:hypothetical protein